MSRTSTSDAAESIPSFCFVAGSGLISTKKLVGRNLTLVLEFKLWKVSDLLLSSSCNSKVLVDCPSFRHIG